MVQFSTTAYIDVELSYFREEDIVDYLRDLGYSINEESYYDASLTDFDEDDMIDHLESCGYTVTYNVNSEMNHVMWEYKYGNILEAMKLLEKCYPELEGLHKKFV